MLPRISWNGKLIALVAGALGAAIVNAAAAVPPNDDCVNATPITGVGLFDFDNTTATEDGPAHDACIDAEVSPLGNIAHDVWFCWTASCSGPVEVDTCDQTDVDTRIAVYYGCACPPTDDTLFPVGCNDDYEPCWLQSSVTFSAVAGQEYLVRVGTYPGEENGLPAPGGPGTFRLTCGDAPCQQDVSWGSCQVPHSLNGNLSNRDDYIAADDFRPQVGGDITELCWWGSYFRDYPWEDTFEVRYYADAEGLPGALIGGPFVQGDGTLTVTGPVNTAIGTLFPVFEYTATHEAVAVTAGECYWVEITNDTGINWWYWQQGIGGNLLSLTDGEQEPQTPPDGYDVDDEEPADLGFCFNLPVESCSPSPCEGATGDCCAPAPDPPYLPGCADAECCARVCACDSFCCDPNNGWDEYCAGNGFDDSGCGAAVLCNDLCAGCPDGSVNWITPHDGFIDPRQPHPLHDAGARQGVDSFLVEAPTPAGEACWTRCETDQGGLPNDIVDVDHLGFGLYNVILEHPLAAGALTQITYTSDTAVKHTGSFAALPADTDGDGTSNPADVTQLVNCLNSAACPLWQTDINRSGTTNAQDLLRLMDLLNGAHDFDVWNQQTLPTECP